jgi:hypothetical protein
MTGSQFSTYCVVLIQTELYAVCSVLKELSEIHFLSIRSQGVAACLTDAYPLSRKEHCFNPLKPSGYCSYRLLLTHYETQNSACRV